MAVCSLLQNLTRLQFLYQEFMLLLPTGVIYVILYHYGLPLLSLVVYLLLCLLIMPMIYIKFIIGIASSEMVNLALSFANIYFNTKKQLLIGIAGFLISGGSMFTALWICLHHFTFFHVDHVMMLFPKTEIVAITVLLVTLQPLLEELFWRGFIQVFFTGGISYSHPSELVCSWVAVHYALMHVFVIASFTQHIWQAAILAIPFLFIARKLIFYRHHGVLTTILGHIGLNVGFLVLLNIYFWNKWGIHHE